MRIYKGNGETSLVQPPLNQAVGNLSMAKLMPLYAQEHHVGSSRKNSLGDAILHRKEVVAAFYWDADSFREGGHMEGEARGIILVVGNMPAALICFHFICRSDTGANSFSRGAFISFVSI